MTFGIPCTEFLGRNPPCFGLGVEVSLGLTLREGRVGLGMD